MIFVWTANNFPMHFAKSLPLQPSESRLVLNWFLCELCSKYHYTIDNRQWNFLPEKLKFEHTLKCLKCVFKLWIFLFFIEPQVKHISFASQQSKLPLCIQFSKSFWNLIFKIFTLIHPKGLRIYFFPSLRPIGGMRIIFPSICLNRPSLTKLT